MSLNWFQESEGPLNEAASFEKSIKHDKHIMSFALYELAMIHINRDEVRKGAGLRGVAKVCEREREEGDWSGLVLNSYNGYYCILFLLSSPSLTAVC